MYYNKSYLVKNILFYSVGHWQICLRAAPGRAEVGCGPGRAGLEIAGRAENFRPVHISNVQVKLCDPSLTRTIPERFVMSQTHQKRYTNARFPCIVIVLSLK